MPPKRLSTQKPRPSWGEQFELFVTGQQFRHVIGYLYLKAHPGNYEVVRELLGHKDINTTMAFYAALEMRTASKEVSAFVARRRKELAPLLRKRKRISSASSYGTDTGG